MGESKLKLAKREAMLLSGARVQTMAGRMQVRWESGSATTPIGQLACFIEFLTLLSFVEADCKAGKQITGCDSQSGPAHRDRADAENAFDEFKNQCGWGGFATHDLHRCQLAARTVALSITRGVSSCGWQTPRKDAKRSPVARG